MKGKVDLMQVQDSLFNDRIEPIKYNESATAGKVYNYLEYRYQDRKGKLFVLEPGLRGQKLSADKVQSGSGNNSTEDALIRYIDAKREIEQCEKALEYLSLTEWGILKHRYMEYMKDIDIAKRMQLTTNDRESNVIIPNQTYWYRKRKEANDFAQMFAITGTVLMVE